MKVYNSLLTVAASTPPLMDGTASVGTEQTYARGDHVHPTDTSRASQTDMTAVQNKAWYLSNNGQSFDGLSLELNKTGALQGYGGFINFHYNGSANDFTSRIIEDGNGRINVQAPSGVYMSGNRFYPAINNSCTGDSNITFVVNQAQLVSNIGILNLRFKTSTAISGYAASGIHVPDNMKPTASRNIFAACYMGSSVLIRQWQVLDTGIVRCETAMPANQEILVTLIYAIKQ